jgi:hypothetical protein
MFDGRKRVKTDPFLSVELLSSVKRSEKASCVPEEEVESKALDLVQQLADGRTHSYAGVKQILKAWSSGGVAGADAVMLDVVLSLHEATAAARTK